METKSNHNPNNTTTENHQPAMDKFKEALIQFAHSNPTLFPNDATNTYSRLIEQRFSQFFSDLRIPNHPPYAAMIHRAIWELKEKGGSSEESISEHIKREYVDLPWAHSTLLKHHLEKLCERKEIHMTHKQSFLLGGADSDPISSSISDKQLKRKQNSELGKKNSRHRKKHKSRLDSGKNKKYKKKKEHGLDYLQETNKQIVEVVQEQDQVLQPLDKVANEQENIIHNGENCEGDSDEHNQMIEVNMIDIPIIYENVVAKSVDAEEKIQVDKMENGVAEDVDKDGETNESHPDNSGYINFGQIQTNQNPQLEKSPDSNPILLKSQHLGKQVLTRSQIKSISKKDASLYAYVPNDEHLPEEEKQKMNGQRAKLRSSQKNTAHLETVMESESESQQKSSSSSLEKPLKELINPICTKLRVQFPDLDESATEVQEPGNSQQDQQPDELEDKPKYKGRGRRPKYKGRGRHPAAFSKEVKHSHVKKGHQGKKHSHVKKGHQGQQSNEEEEAKYNGHGRHKMMRRSSRKTKDLNR